MNPAGVAATPSSVASGGSSAGGTRDQRRPSFDHHAVEPVGEPSGPASPMATKRPRAAATPTTLESDASAGASFATVQLRPSDETQKRALGTAFGWPAHPPAANTVPPATAAAWTGPAASVPDTPAADATGSRVSCQWRPSADVQAAGAVPWRPTATMVDPFAATPARGVSSAAGMSATRSQRRPPADVQTAARKPGTTWPTATRIRPATVTAWRCAWPGG